MPRKNNTPAQIDTNVITAEDEKLLAALEVKSAPATEATEAGQAQAAAETDQAPAFLDSFNALDDGSRTAHAQKVSREFDLRADYEHTTKPGNTSILAKLKKERGRMQSLGLAGAMLAINVDPGFINREIVTGKRFNIYAIDKTNDLLSALAHGSMRNKVNIAVMRSLFACRAAGYQFTGAIAQAAVSDKVRVDKAIAAILVRHSVSAATAPTQTSSTMNALETLGVVINRGNQKFPLWELTESPQTQRLADVLGIAA